MRRESSSWLSFRCKDASMSDDRMESKWIVFREADVSAYALVESVILEVFRIFFLGFNSFGDSIATNRILVRRCEYIHKTCHCLPASTSRGHGISHRCSCPVFHRLLSEWCQPYASGEDRRLVFSRFVSGKFCGPSIPVQVPTIPRLSFSLPQQFRDLDPTGSLISLWI